MSEEEYIRNRLDQINKNSHYGLMIDTEITKTVRNHLKRLEEATMHADCEFCIKRDICTKDVPKPCKYRYTEDERKADQASDMFGNILHKTYLHPTFRKKKEETKMNATSVQKIENVKGISFIIEEKHKLSIVASTNDDIFEFDFEGPEIIQQCKASGLFTGWEKGQKIKELEKELGDLKKEAANCLVLRDERKEEAIKLKQDNAKLRRQLRQVERDKKRLTERYKDLEDHYNLQEAANEAQHKFIKEYAGNDTEVQFNYAIRSGPITYCLYDKDYIDKLRKEIHSLKVLKTPTIENFADEEPSTRADILDKAKECVCGHREQDYGTPESNFQLIADLWNQYLFKEPGAKEIFGIGPMDVSMMMALMKIARIRNGGGSGDSFVDLAGYAACGGEIWHLNKETDGDSSQETDTV